MKKKEKNNNKINIKKFFSKKMVICYIVLLIDLGLIIYCASRNILNYVMVNGERMLIGNGRKRFLGRNNVTIVVTLFIYLYICLLNKFVFKKKFKILFYVILFILLIVFNCIMFFVFSKKVY